MDPHFHEYLAAIAGMHAVYGAFPDEHPTEFHEDRVSMVVEESVVALIPAAAGLEPKTMTSAGALSHDSARHRWSTSNRFRNQGIVGGVRAG